METLLLLTKGPPFQSAIAGREWTYLWLAIVGMTLLVSIAVAAFVFLRGRTSKLGRLTQIPLMRRLERVLSERVPGLWKFIRRRFTTDNSRGLALTVAGIVVFAALYVFALITEGWTDEEALFIVDQRVYDWLMQAGGAQTIDIFRVVTHLADGLTVTILGLVLAGYLFYRRHFWSIAALVLGPGGGFLLVVGLKALFERARPEMQAYEVTGHSFPSGHAFAAMTFYGFLIYVVWRDVKSEVWRIILATGLSVLILLIGLSRVILRVHWVSDVAGGFTVGLAWLLISLVMVRGLSDRSRPRPDTEQ